MIKLSAEKQIPLKEKIIINDGCGGINYYFESFHTLDNVNTVEFSNKELKIKI